MNKLQPDNLLNQETIINTRKEHWNTLFCWIDFSKTKWKDKVYNKEQQFWPMPQTFVDWQKEVTQLLVEKHTEIENLINSFKGYFLSEVYPILKSKEGDKTLLFRCERLLNDKMIGETSSLFLDLLIFEREYLAIIVAKRLLAGIEEETAREIPEELAIAYKKRAGEIPLESWETREGLEAYIKELEEQLIIGTEPEAQTETTFFSNPNLERKIKEDIGKLLSGKINFEVFSFFIRKWLAFISEEGTNEGKELFEEFQDFWHDWEKGKIGVSQWKGQFDEFKKEIEEYFYSGAGDNVFFQLGFIKKQAKWKEKWMDLDGLVIATQNRKGWNLLNPYLMLFWFHQKPSSNNALAYRSYFVNNFTMTNPRNLYVTLDLQEDWIWKNFGRALLSPGTLKSENHPIYHQRNLPTTLTDKKLHYPFCEDLGDKEVYYLDTDEQPKWQLYIINHPNFVEKLSDDMSGLFDGGNLTDFYDSSNIQLPKNIYKIERYKPKTTGAIKGEVNLFIAPEDFYTGKTGLGVGTKTSNNFFEKSHPNLSFKLAEYDYTTKNPTSINSLLRKQINDNLTSYNHLIDHSSFQFCFSQETMFSANLRYLNFKKEEEEWLIKYILKVKATPAGTYYTYLSGCILWQLRVEVKQTFPAGKTLKSLLTLGMATVTVTGAFMLAGAMGLGGAGLTDGSILNKISGDLGKLQKTSQLLQQAKSILPEENENISFSFSLFDFWSKLRKRPFWGKIYVSNNLKNNLAHNNNQNPITFPLNITFDKLWKVIKKGEYQGNLKLDYDPGRYLSNKFQQGITFFEDKSKDFITPELGLKEATNLTVYNLGNAGSYISEEIREEEVVEVNRPKGANFHQRVHYLIEYEDGSKEHWLGLLPRFQDSDLTDGHTHGTFNLYFDKPVKYFWDVYTCIGCGARGQFLDLHSGYDGNSDSWDTLYKDLPVEPWLGDVENTSSLRWCGKNMGSRWCLSWLQRTKT